jgi:hypothetical protein
MANQDLTIFQKLTQIFGWQGRTQQTPPSFNFSREELLKTDDPVEFEKAKLQAQQSQFLFDKWAKLDNSLYNQSVYYEPNRLAAYYDYESMEFTPEVSAALDIYAEESTTMSEKGHILNVYSESNRIKSVLIDLFENQLDVNTNLQMWARNLCKYGDNFVYLKIDPEKGVVGCHQLPNIEIDRLEGAQGNAANKSTSDIKTQTKELRFTWKNRDMELGNCSL